MAGLTDQLRDAGDELGKAVDSAGDALRMRVQEASDMVADLLERAEQEAGELSDEAREEFEAISRIESLVEEADGETREHLENAKASLEETRGEH